MTETTLHRITKHVYWMSPGQPDRPSLAAVVGTKHTLMLDAGASEAHVRLFLSALRAANVPTPHFVALTHWHWDHVFGAAALNLPVIAGAATAGRLHVLATYDWSDAALDERVATGEEILMCAEDIKVELPEPREVHIALPDIVFEAALELNLGGVTCRIQHVGGDHAADSCVMFIPEDGVLFLGDCLYEAIYTPQRHYTPENLLPLLDTVLAYDAGHFVEGHDDRVMSRPELDDIAAKMRLAARLVDQFNADEQAALAHLPQPPDEDTADFIQAFAAGRRLNIKP